MMASLVAYVAEMNARTQRSRHFARLCRPLSPKYPHRRKTTTARASPPPEYIELLRMLQIDMDDFISVAGLLCDSTVIIQQVDCKVLVRYHTSGSTCRAV